MATGWEEFKAVEVPEATNPSEDPWAGFKRVEAKQTLEGNALSRGLSRGSDMAGQFYGSTLESIGKATGLESLEESGRARAARNRAELQASTPSMTTEDIEGVGSLGSFVGEKLGESAIPMGTSIAAAAGAGALAGAAATAISGPGAVVGAVAGAIIAGGAATLASLPYMFGSFRERQKDEDIAAGRPIEVDEGAALAAALPASALEGVSDVFLAGPLLKIFKPLAQSGNILTRVTTNAATGASVESLTEVGQTVLERYQAGLSLTDEEAQNEYFEAAVAGGLVGGTVSGAVNIRKPKPETGAPPPTPDTTPTVENISGGTDAAARSALRNDTTRTETRTVDPDQAAALGGAPSIGEKTREIMAGMRAKSAAAPTPAPTVEPNVEPNVQSRPSVTPVGNASPVSEPTAQVQNLTEQVASAPATSPTSQAAQGIERGMAAMAEGARRAGRQRVADLISQGQPVTYRNPEAVAQAKADPQQVVIENPDGSVTVTGIKVDEDSDWIGTAPEQAPVTEGTELDETLLADTALNEEVTGAEAAGDTLPTVPEAPETLAAQGEALTDRKNKRKAVYIPPETLGEVEADALPVGKNVFSMRLPNGGMLFWNYTKIGLSKKDVTELYKDGKLGQLLGLGPFNKAEVAASGGTQDLAVVERTAKGVPVKEVGATEVTAPAQIAALEAEKTEGSTIEVVPAAAAIAERQAASTAKNKDIGAINEGRSEQTRDGKGRAESGSLTPLEGTPTIEGASGPDPKLVSVAEKYAKSIGVKLARQSEFVEVDPERGARIAKAYEEMEDAPQNPVVREAYQNLIRQTLAQYQALVDAGYQFWFIDIDNDGGYADTPWNAMRDLRANQRMGVFPTTSGYGTGDVTLDVEANPLLADTGLEWSFGGPDGPKKPVLANDLFRAVHDAFGHGLEGAGFRARGEENAWQAHVRLFTGSAVGAITSETRGQNSWLNFGPYGEANRTAKVEDTIFADQKIGLMPSWTWEEGRAGDMPYATSEVTAPKAAPKATRPKKYAEVISETPEGYKFFNEIWISFEGKLGVNNIRMTSVKGEKVFPSAPGLEPDSTVVDLWGLPYDEIYKVEPRRGAKLGIESLEEYMFPDLVPAFRDYLLGNIDAVQALERIKNTDIGAADAQQQETQEATSEVTAPKATLKAAAPKAEVVREVAKARSEPKVEPKPKAKKVKETSENRSKSTASSFVQDIYTDEKTGLRMADVIVFVGSKGEEVSGGKGSPRRVRRMARPADIKQWEDNGKKAVSPPEKAKVEKSETSDTDTSFDMNEFSGMTAEEQAAKVARVKKALEAKDAKEKASLEKIRAADKAREDKDERRATVMASANRGELDAEEELTARISKAEASNNPGRAKVKLTNWRRANQLMRDMVPEETADISSMEAAVPVFERFAQTLAEAKKRGIEIGTQVSDDIPNSMAWLIHMQTLHGKMRAYDKATPSKRKEIFGSLVDFIINENDMMSTGNSVDLRAERKRVSDSITESRKGTSAEGMEDVSANASDNTDTDTGTDTGTDADTSEKNPFETGEVFDPNEETETETDPDDFEMAPTSEPVRAIEIDESIPTYTAGVSKTAKVEVRNSRASARAAMQQIIRARMEAASNNDDQLTLGAAEKPLGMDAGQKLVETLRPDDVVGLEIIDRITSSGKALSDMTLAERTALFKDMKGVDPNKVEESIAIAKLPLANFQALLEGKSFLRALTRNLKFMDAMPAAIQKALGTNLLAQMNRIAGDVEVLVVDDADIPALAPGKVGYFWPRGDYIVIRASLFENNNAAQLQHTITHEAGHAAMWHAIRDNKVLRNQLDVVLKASNAYADKMGIMEFSNGLRNIDEFASELVSNPRFQNFLTGVSLSKTDLYKLGIRPSLAAQVRNALDAIKVKLLDAIGWDKAMLAVGMDPNKATALSTGLDIIANLLDVAPAARTRFQQMISDAAALPMDSDTGIYGRLKQRGLDDEQALNVAAVIDQEFGGTATDEELDALAGALSKPIASQQGLTGPSPFIPPKLPGRVAKLFGMGGGPKSGPVNRTLLYLMTLDFIDTSFRKYFGDKAGNALTDYVNAAFKFRKVADDIASLHDLDFADFADLKKSKPDEALKIQKLVGMLEAVDVDISDGATNDHLKNTNARKLLQSKAALPEIKKIMASMDPETLALVRRMAKNFTESHNDYLKAVTYTILEGLDTKLSNSDMMRIMDNVINGRLDAQDKADINDDAVFAQLERSEFLKRRKGSYFPAARFGENVVTTDIAVSDPKITSVVTKSTRQKVAITTEIDGGTVRFTFDGEIRGARPAVTKKLYEWVSNHELPLASYVVKYRDRQTGQIVNKGEMDVTKDYDVVHEIKLQNKGVHFFEDINAARDFQTQAAADVAAGKLLRASDVLPKHAEAARDHLIPPGALDAVFASIDKNQKIDQARKNQLKQAARDAITRNMAGNRYEKRLMGRQNIIGASDDVGRSAAHYGRSVGNAIAQIRSGGERAEALARMRQIAKARQDEVGIGGVVGDVVNEVVKREGLDMGPLNNNQLLDDLSTINSIDKLLSPANWFLNGTQVPMNSLPYLGGRFGNVNAGRTILSAYRRIGAAGVLKTGLKNTGKAATSVGKNRIDLENTIASIRKNVGVKYNDLFDELISTNDITDNTGIENAQQLAADRGTMGRALVSMDRIMRAMPNAIEAINRSTSAVAAYDLALGSGMSKADAIAYARETLRRTQFRYDETNKSRMMRSTPALRFFFTFKQYGQGQYQMLTDALTRAFKDASPTERAMARKQLYTMFMIQIAAAGVFSVPAIELIKTAVMLGAALGLGEGWDDDVDEMRKFMRETYGETVDEIVSKGALSKILGVDLSGRMSWADLIVGYPPKSGEKQDLLAWVGNALAGPQGSMVYEFFIGGPKALLEGEYAKALTMMLPVKTASDTVKAVAGAAEGKMDTADAVKQVLGFKSLRQARISDETGTQIRERGQKKKEASSLISDYISAVSRGDVVRAAAAIREYNSKLKEGERKINIGSRTSGLEKLRLENVQRYAE